MSNQPEMPTPDTPQLLLEHHLKALRLPTILRGYDKVAPQCAAEKVDFPRYLVDPEKVTFQIGLHDTCGPSGARMS
jgi:hypothetical protein